MDLKQHVRTVPDFPEKGIMFRDVTTLFNNAEAFAEMINQFHSSWGEHKIDAIAGIDARGFVIGGALAYKMKPFVALRKKGKLPFETSAKNMIWNMARRRWKSIKMLSHLGRMYW